MESPKYMINKDYKEINYRTKSYGDKGILLTADNGRWILLTKEEYEKFVLAKLDKELFEKLENALVIKTKNNTEKLIKNAETYFWDITNSTSLHILVPTLRCNHTCSYCYAFRKPEDAEGFDMSEDTAKKVVDFIFQGPARNIVIEFTGGEPLAKFDIIKYVVLYAKEKNLVANKILDFAIVNNGSLLDEEKLQFIKENKIGLCFSLDGPKDLHDLNRKFTLEPKRSSYEMIMNVIEDTKKKYNRVFAIPVITKASLSRYKEIIDLYVKLGFPSFRYKYITDFGFATANWNHLAYGAEEFVEVWKKILDYILELNRKGIKIREEVSSILIQKLLMGRNPGFAELACPCGAIDGQILYDYDGGIYSCDEARTLGDDFKLGNVHNNTFYDLRNNKIRQVMKCNSSMLGFTCDACPWYIYCGICPLENYKKEGTMVVNLPNKNLRCMIHKEMIETLFEKILFNREERELLRKWPSFN